MVSILPKSLIINEKGRISKSSPNYRLKYYLDEKPKNFPTGDTITNAVGTKNSGTVEACQDFHGVSKDRRKIMSDRMAHGGGNIVSE